MFYFKLGQIFLKLPKDQLKRVKMTQNYAVIQTVDHTQEHKHTMAASKPI
jgi:hypothetical protein